MPTAYVPSEAAAIVFAVLYGVVCIITTVQYFVYKCWFWIFMVIGSIMMMVGYVAKAWSTTQMQNVGLGRTLYIISFVLPFLAPAVIAASCYQCMGRIALYVTPRRHQNWKTLWIAPRFMTLVFVLCDVVAFLIQVFGAILAVSQNADTVIKGFNVLKVGLVVQIVAFGFFLVISFRFHIVSGSFRQEWPDTRWKAMLWAINGGSSMIFVRSVYRFVEFTSGVTGYLNTHEWNGYVFDSALMFIVIAIFNFWHPAKYLSNIGFRQTSGKMARAGLDEEFIDLDSQSHANLPHQIPHQTNESR